ncbi:MAG TPA: hypothetical protein VLR94_02950, partial [Acidobacteriota bacterium]|nr:hypothetical protein [Acidobacteriota bacterium]
MSPLEICFLAFGCIFGCMLLGMFLQGRLPEHHLNPDSRDVMKLGTGMIATMAAIVLGLLISSAKGTFDTITNGLRQTASKIILLDRTMAGYGPETREARDILRQAVATTIEQIWFAKKDAIALEKAVGGRTLEELSRKLGQLSPQNEDQRRLQLRGLQITGEISETRLHIMTHVGQRSFPMPLFALLVCWLSIIFFSFGLLSSRNTTVLVVLFVCALSASSSLFLSLELDQPFGGLIQVSSAP